jgi:hypothetical protein
MNDDLESCLRDAAGNITLPLDNRAGPTKARLDQERRWLRATPPPTAPGSYLLVLGRHGDAPYWRALHEPELVVGRAPDSGLTLDSQRVSKRHAVLASDGTDWCVRDAGSTNGIWVNERKRELAWLASGDLLQLGDTLLLFLQVRDLEP